MQPFPRKLLLYSIFFNEWKSVKLSLVVLTPLPLHITTRPSGPARGSSSRGGRLDRKHGCIAVCDRPGHSTSGVARMTGSVAISCNEDSSRRRVWVISLEDQTHFLNPRLLVMYEGGTWHWFRVNSFMPGDLDQSLLNQKITSTLYSRFG